MEDYENSVFVSKNKHWSVGECFEFILEIKKRPVLWNTRIPENRNKYLRGNSVKEVAKIFAVSEEEVTRKLRNLKTQFAEQQKKFKRQDKRKGSGSLKPKWVYFDAMRFMEDAISSRSTASSLHKSFDKGEREMPLNELLKDEFIDEKSIEEVESIDPEGLPLVNNEIFFEEECNLESKIDIGLVGVEIKQEKLDNENDVQIKTQWEGDLITDRGEKFGDTSLSDLFHSKGTELLFMQVPDVESEELSDCIRPSSSPEPSTSTGTRSQHNSNNKKLWSMEESFQFISEIEKRPMMWDSRNPEYRNKIMRMGSMKEIAEIFAISEEEVARKLKNLKTQFAEQLKKINTHALSSSLGCRKPKWAYFDAMRYMEDALSSSPMINEDSEENDSTSNINISPTPSVSHSKKRKPDVLYEAAKSNLLKKTKVDKWQLFCDYLAEEFRSMQPKHQRELKQTILQYLFKIGEGGGTTVMHINTEV